MGKAKSREEASPKSKGGGTVNKQGGSRAEKPAKPKGGGTVNKQGGS